MTKKIAKTARTAAAKPKKAAALAKKPTASGTPAFPPNYMKPLTEYSPYAQHRVLLEKFGTDEAGQAKVLKHGTEVLGLPVTQVKTYIKEKLNAIKRDAEKKLGLHPSTPQLAKVARGEYEPDFKFKTREAAKTAMLAVVRRNKMSESCFHVLSEDGQFAFVPAHIRPAGKPAPLKDGDIVMDTTIADSRAEVIGGGPEQSVVRYLTERKYAPQEQCVSNYYLHKVGTKATMKAELEKLAAAKVKKAAVAALVAPGPVEKAAVPKPAKKRLAKGGPKKPLKGK